MRTIDNTIKALQYLCNTLGKKDIPLYWVMLILLVAESGSNGTTTKEVAENINMSQGIASRTVKLLSKYVNPVTKQLEGLGILVALQNDLHYRHRQRIYLTEHGKQMVEKLTSILEK